jgi:hypothetical protein
MFSLAIASGAVAPVISFVVVVPTTAFIPFNEVHKISESLGVDNSPPSIILYHFPYTFCTIIRRFLILIHDI